MVTAADDDRCPHCGYCRRCGRSDQPALPYQPIWVVPYGPAWPGMQITCSGATTTTGYMITYT